MLKAYSRDIITTSTRQVTTMIFETVRDIIAAQLGMGASKITPESDIINDLGLDSLDIVELVMTLEEKWNIVADDEDIKTLKTVADVVKYIENNAR